ncbi:MAG: YihY/virulence factor BrkB family protein [Acidobacteriota bacterium]
MSGTPLARGFRLLRLIVIKTQNDGILLSSAALAFLTIIALVPALSTFSYLSARIYTERGQTQIVVDFLGKILPWSEAEILSKLQEFLTQAETIHGVGFLFFLFTILVVFGSIEGTINRIWRVSSDRPLRKRLLSFTLVFFWGPLLIGAAYSLAFLIRRQPMFERLDISLIVRGLPFVVTLIGLTMLYWLVPNIHVRFRAALVGGLTAALLLETVRWGYSRYVDLYQQHSIYGSFGLVLLFMVSLNVAWSIVLFGSEVAYGWQHARMLLTTHRDPIPLEGSWLGLMATLALTHAFRDGRPILTHDSLATTLELDPDDVARVLAPLVAADLVGEASDDTIDGYLLTCDPYQTTAVDVMTCYDTLHGQRLGELRQKLNDLHTKVFRKKTLAALANDEKLALEALPATTDFDAPRDADSLTDRATTEPARSTA